MRAPETSQHSAQTTEEAHGGNAPTVQAQGADASVTSEVEAPAKAGKAQAKSKRRPQNDTSTTAPEPSGPQTTAESRTTAPAPAKASAGKSAAVEEAEPEGHSRDENPPLPPRTQKNDAKDRPQKSLPDNRQSDAGAQKQQGGKQPPKGNQAPEKGPKKGLFGKRFWGIALLCGLGYWWWPSGPDACDQALADTQTAMQQQNATAADQHSKAAVAACTDSERARLAQTAQTGAQALLKAQRQAKEQADREARKLAQQQAKQQAACTNASRQITGLLQSARLDSATRALDKLDSTCRESVQPLLAQVDTAQATAQKAQSDARAQIESGALDQARTSIELLASVNRESSALAELRAALGKAQAPAALQPSKPAPAAPAAMPAAQADLVRGFMRDAELHMKQRMYDKAKTYAESARRLDPNNPEIDRLLKRIKADELAYMRKEIVID